MIIYISITNSDLRMFTDKKINMKKFVHNLNYL